MPFHKLPDALSCLVCSFLARDALHALLLVDQSTSLFLAPGRRSRGLKGRSEGAADVGSDAIWRAYVERAWSLHVERGRFGSWFEAVAWLEGVCYPALKYCGVKSAIKLLAQEGMLRQSTESDLVADRVNDADTRASFGGGYDAWKSAACLHIVQAIMRCRTDLECRRRVAAFVCSSSFIGDEDSHAASRPTQGTAAGAGAGADADAPENADVASVADTNSWHTDEYADVDAVSNADIDNLTAFLCGFDLSTTVDPEQALRKLLLEFPFLPIDAGEGADRVLKTVAVVYLAQHPEQARDLRQSLQARGAASEHRDAESVVYILIYAIIMLNTDLHNPKIKVKMTMNEFVRSATSTVLADVFSARELNRMYRSIKRAPLRICSPSVDQSKLRHLHVPAGASSGKAATSSDAGGPERTSGAERAGFAAAHMRLLVGLAVMAAAAWLLRRLAVRGCEFADGVRHVGAIVV